MVYYLVYLSTATDLFSKEDLVSILTVSRANNSAHAITGILLYHNGNIIQVLEGEKGKVRNLYNKIGKDARHKGVIQLVDGLSEERSFADWSMGFKAIDTSEWQEYEGYFQMKTKQLLNVIKNKNKKIDTTLSSFVKTSAR